MLLSELKVAEPTGTYAAVIPTDGTLALVQDWAAKNCIVLDDALHVTLLYSRKVVNVELCDSEYVATGVRFDKLGDALVLVLQCQALVDRHEQFMAQGGTHDFDEFILHMTIQTKTDLNPDEVPMMDFGLVFGREYTEPLRP
jgi:hypothetical protein